jgi:hypothetical protein
VIGPPRGCSDCVFLFFSFLFFFVLMQFEVLSRSELGARLQMEHENVKALERENDKLKVLFLSPASFPLSLSPLSSFLIRL